MKNADRSSGKPPHPNGEEEIPGDIFYSALVRNRRNKSVSTSMPQK